MNEVEKYIYVLFGAIILSIGVAVFLAANNIALGGPPGLAIVLNYYLKMQLGLLMFCISAPLILLCFKYVNKKSAFRTIFSICITSFTVDFIYEFLGYKGLIIDQFYASIIGGSLVGLGIAIVIKSDTAAGGLAVIAKIIANNSEIKESNIIIIMDIVIVILAGIIFDDLRIALYSLLSVYACLKVIDLILFKRVRFLW